MSLTESAVEFEPKQFLEAWGDQVGSFDPYNVDGQPVGGLLSRRFGWHTRPYDRADGRFIPVFENEMDLKAIRMACRLMDVLVPSAQAIRNRLLDYTISGGFDWTVTHESPELQAWCKAVVKRFYDDAAFIELERESFHAELVDGEYMGQLVAEDGCISLQTCEPDWLTEPLDKQQLDRWLDLPFTPTWTFGVLRRQYRDKAYGYHIVRDESGCDWDFVQANRFVHWTRNVPRQAKRGYPDGYVTHAYLGHGDKVGRNTAIGTAIQAAIAFIVEHAEGTSRTQVQQMVAGLNNQAVNRDYTGRQAVGTSIASTPGRRLDVMKGQKYTNGPLGSANTNIYIDVMEAMFRLAGTPHSIPEHMVTGTAENNNYASTLVTESPFVQGRMADMRVRSGRLKRLLMNVLELACSLCHKDWAEVRQGLDIGLTEPDIVSRDIKVTTDALIAQAAQGWVDDKTAISELGRDYDTIKKNIEEQIEQTGGGIGQPGSQATMGAISRQQWKRNAAAVKDIKKALANGEYTAPHAKVLMTSLGFSGAQSDKLLADVAPEILQQQPIPEAPKKPQQARIAGPVKESKKLTKTQRRLIDDWSEYP